MPQKLCRALVGAAVLAGLAIGLAAGVAGAEIIDRLLAVAAGDVIMLSDVQAARDLGLVRPVGASDPVREVLTRLIDRSLILAEVERYAPPEPLVDSIDRELATVRSRFGSSQQFEAALARSGVTAAHVRETLRQDLRIRAYLEQRFAVPTPGDDELRRYFGEQPERFTRGGAPLSFEEARTEVAAAATEERRQRLMSDWVAGLRSRADILDLYRPATRN